MPELAEISVIIPLYNKAGFIGDALESIFKQALPPREILIIDDGSEDGGAELARQTAIAGDRKVRIISQPNSGVSAARNKGIEEASCPWLAFLDADDTWDPGFLLECVKALDRHPMLGAVFGSIVEVRGGRTRRLLPRARDVVVIGDYPRWFIRHRGYGFWSSNTVVARSAIVKAGGFPIGVQNGEDTDTWFRLADVVQLAYAPGARAYYRMLDSASLSRRIRARRPPVLDSLEGLLAGSGSGRIGKASIRVAIYYFHAAYAVALSQEGRKAEAFRELGKSRLLPILLWTWCRALLALIIGK